MSFTTATAVTTEDGRHFAGSIHPGWDIAGNANGGYLIAIAARALARATGRPDPITTTGHFLAPGRPGPIEIEADVVRDGGRMATARATVHSTDRPLLAVLSTWGDLAGPDAPERVDASPPDLPAVTSCPLIEGTDSFPPPFMDHVELRLHPEDAGFATGIRSGEPRVRGWFRLPDGEPVDTLALLMAVDAFPPTIFNADLPVAWTPTVELTAHVRCRPASGWLRSAFTTRFITGGFLEADGEIWDDTGRLVAQSRQLALVPHGRD